MLLVKTYIGLSPIHGIGLYTAEPIKKGTRIWEFTPGFDLIIEKEIITSLPSIQQEQILNYAYLDRQTGKYLLCADNARFFNHSTTPNAEDIETPNITIAARDIEKNEEITSNYKTFDMDYEKKFCKFKQKI